MLGYGAFSGLSCKVKWAAGSFLAAVNSHLRVFFQQYSQCYLKLKKVLYDLTIQQIVLFNIL